MAKNYEETVTFSILNMYARLFKNPAAMVFLVLFFILYGVVVSVSTSRVELNLVDLAKAAPFAVSAVVLGFFSVLFWALNYVAKE